MEINNHSYYDNSNATTILRKIFIDNIKDIDMYVEQIIICDDDDLENELMNFNPNKKLTKLPGCKVEGKTILGSEKAIIFIASGILKDIFDNISLEDENVIKFNNKSLFSLRTIFHEVGHAIRITEYGEIRLKKVANSYREMFNEHWKVLQDEFYAESYCSNLLKINQSLSWYGNFSDKIESNNFLLNFEEYINKDKSQNGSIAFYMLHQYYFIPLFQKSGFLYGAKQFICLNNVKICHTIKKIMNLMTKENTFVPVEFNSMILKKWDDFRIKDLLSGNLNVN